MKLNKAFLALFAVLLLAFGVAACGGDEEPAGGSGSGGTTEDSSNGGESAGGGNLIQKDDANAGKSITIGSKNFPEQYILGEIYAQALTAAGFDVKKELDLGAEQVAYKALKNGTVDAYPEYSGTALTSFYDVKTDDVDRDPQASYDQLVELAKKDGVTAMPQTPFQNTYRVTSTKATAEKYGNPKTMSELGEKAGDASLSGFPECRQRADCLLGMNSKYNWKPKFISSQGQYADLDKGQADFTMGFSTDGALSTDKYVSYEDDKGLFPPYYVSLLVSEEATATLGASGKAVIEKIQKPMTNEVMQELNARVSIDKGKPEDVAAQYLKESGFTE